MTDNGQILSVLDVTLEEQETGYVEPLMVIPPSPAAPMAPTAPAAQPMVIDLSVPRSYQEMERDADLIKRQLAAKRRQERAADLAIVKGLVLKHAFTFDEVGFERPASPQKGTTLPVKFRGPKGETWTGRGQTPVWLRDYPRDQWDKFRV